jgi:hypothetical protein
MHPRGTVSFSDGNEFIRASVWIEQEIAIAAYIQRTLKQDLQVAAYAHESVEREGLRELLQLNPTKFTESSEVLSHLNKVLKGWQPDKGIASLQSRGEIASINLISRRGSSVSPLKTANIILSIQNLGSGRSREYAGTITVPAATLSFGSGAYAAEVSPLRDGYRSFRRTEKSPGSVPIFAGDTLHLVSVEIAVEHLSDGVRAQALETDVIGDAEAHREALQISKPLRDLMSVAM